MPSSAPLSISTQDTHTLLAYQNRGSVSPAPPAHIETAHQEPKTPSDPTNSQVMRKVLEAEICFGNGRIRRSDSSNLQSEMQSRRQLLDRLRLTLQSNVLNGNLHGATKRLGEHIAGLLDKFIAAEIYFRSPVDTVHLPVSFWSDLSHDGRQLINSIQEEISSGNYVGSQPDLFKEFGRIICALVLNMRQLNHAVGYRRFSNNGTQTDHIRNETIQQLGHDITCLQGNVQKSWTLCKVEKTLLTIVLDLIRNSQHFLNAKTSQPART